jgi:hypothetical protein
MTSPYTSRSWNFQGFEILDSNAQPIDGVCRFMFRGFQISVSSRGYSRGSCLNEVAIFKSVPGEDHPYSEWLTDRLGDRLYFNSAQQAIEYIVTNDLKA